MILPARSSQLPVGRDIKIDVLFHAWMVSSGKVLKVISEELKAEPKSKLTMNFYDRSSKNYVPNTICSSNNLKCNNSCS